MLQQIGSCRTRCDCLPRTPKLFDRRIIRVSTRKEVVLYTVCTVLYSSTVQTVGDLTSHNETVQRAYTRRKHTTEKEKRKHTAGGLWRHPRQPACEPPTLALETQQQTVCAYTPSMINIHSQPATYPWCARIQTPRDRQTQTHPPVHTEPNLTTNRQNNTNLWPSYCA